MCECRRDLQTGVITRVSEDAAGAQGNWSSDNPSLSADGRFVAFQSIASNLVAGDTNGTGDVFVKDLQTGAITRVSTEGAGSPSISADGRFVAFASNADNLVPGDTNGFTDVFVKDLQTGAITRVSLDAAGAQGNSHSSSPSLSADGRLVAFWSYANNLVAGATGAQGNNTSEEPSISADGRVRRVSQRCQQLGAG
jgi:Tol biopolymer transport system component